MIDDFQFLICFLQEIAYRSQEFLLSELGSSPLLFLLLGTGYVLDSMRHKRKYISFLFFKGYSHSGLNAVRRLVIVAIIYLPLFFFYTPTIANLVIAIPAALYSIYNLRVSSDWHLIYFLLPVCLSLVLFPNTTTQYLTFSYSLIEELDQGEIIGLIAAFFAFVGWRETSMKGGYSREETLRNRSDEIRLYYNDSITPNYYPDQIEYRADITSIRVDGYRNLSYRFFRYFFLTKFQGKTAVSISFNQDINPNLLSVIDSPSLWHLPIEYLYRTGQGEYKIITKSTDMNRVEGEIYEIFESICLHAHSQENLEVGEYAYPDVFYYFPIRMIDGFLCRNELQIMRPLSRGKKVNIRVDRSRGLRRDDSYSRRTPLTYSFAKHDSRFYRTLQHLIFINLPWNLVQKWIRRKYSKLNEREPLTKYHLNMKDRPLYECLYLLIDAYEDHDITSTYQGLSRRDIDCIFLRIQSDRQDEGWTISNIPICRFHPKKFIDLKITQEQQPFDEIEEELDAKYVVRNREYFYTIYGLKRDYWIIAKWLEFNEEPEEPDVPQKARFSRTVSLNGISLDGVIWKREG